MRALIVTLVLLNIGYFAWANWMSAPAPSGAPRVNASPALPTLSLVEPTSSAATSTPGTSAASTAARCRSLGPFNVPEIARQAAETLRSRGLPVTQRAAKVVTSDGYWVYLADVNDATARQRALVQLRRHGLRDVAVYADAEQVQRVSIGIFADEANAKRRAEEVRKLGFNPQVDPHQRSSDALWLDVQLPAGAAEPATNEIPGAGPAREHGVETDVEFTDCPAGAPGG